MPKNYDNPYQVLEFFAGVGRVAALAKRCGFVAAAVDVEYGRETGKRMGKRSPMDINSNAGLVLRNRIRQLVGAHPVFGEGF